MSENDQLFIQEIGAITRHFADNQLDSAREKNEALLVREPEFPAAWYMKGLIHRQQGEAIPAITAFNKALSYEPDFREACLGLALTLEETGQLTAAINVYEHFLKIEQLIPFARSPAPMAPSAMKQAEHWFREGSLKQKAGEMQASVDAFNKVLAIFPDMPEALLNLALGQHTLGQHEAAYPNIIHALRAKPDYVPGLHMLAMHFGAVGKPLRAIAALRLVLASQPNHADALTNMGRELARLELLEEAIGAYNQALSLRPGDKELLANLLHLEYSLCHWDNIVMLSEQLQQSPNAASWMEPFFIGIHLPEWHLQNAIRYNAHFFPRSESYDVKRPLPAAARASGKLHIGYFSSGFHEHSIAHLISEMFERHDRSRFEISAYSYGAQDFNATQARIRSGVDHYHDTQSLTDNAAAALIRSHGIDILVDLDGFAPGHRLGVLAMRPAPLQMHYLGFPGSIGAHFIDYFVTDGTASPAGAETAFSEQLIRLPNSYQINDRFRPLPIDALPRSYYGLPEQGMVIGALFPSTLITPGLFAVWMRLLLAVPGSVLWLMEEYPAATVSLCEQAKRHGVEPSRLIAAKPLPLPQHLARYRHIDLCVDSFPCNTTVMVSEALWCAVPVVTLAGDTFMGRTGASLLHAAGQKQWVATSIAEVQAMALRLVSDPVLRGQVKSQLEENRMCCKLFDSLATTRALEQAYLMAAQMHKNGIPPEHFSVV